MKSQKQLIENPIILGKIIGHFGVKGWLKVYSHTQPREEITKYKLIYVYLEGNYELIGDSEWNSSGKNILLKLDKTSDRESASKYINLDLVIDRTNLPDLPEGRYYWNDLEGIQVKNIHGNSLGTISHMIETGSNNVVVLSDDRLIPFVLNDVVKEVDLKNRIMIVEWDWDWD
tara:strand:- start:779 stop:1297 length:519 start_codon:yes stop_codon:yes gene_type:complete